jgi:small-conductance mechanosensitive channel
MTTDNPRQRKILRQRRELFDRRREKQRELMQQYDADVVQPVRQALQEECEAIGHEFGEWRSNGLGGSWRFCRYCDKGEYEAWED